MSDSWYIENRTPSEFVDAAVSAIAALRKAAEDSDDDKVTSFAIIAVERIVRLLGSLEAGIACLEMVKFKMMISELPEGLWPKADIQKGQ